VASSYANFSTAFYTKTNVSGVVGSGKLSGIYEGKAPSGTNYPFGIFNLQGAAPIEYAFNATPVLERWYLQMRVYAENALSAENLLDTWIATLGNTLTVTGFTVEWLAKRNRLAPTDQMVSDRYVYGRGQLIEVGIS
jgi:hypothetical protein